MTESTIYRRAVLFQPGYNYLHETGPRRRGQHGMEITFAFIGPLGATTFVFNTMWSPLGEVDPSPSWGQPCHVDREGQYVHHPRGVDVGRHWGSPIPGYEEYAYQSSNCRITGGFCEYDGSGLRADKLLREFISKGEPAVWRELIAFYRSLALESQSSDIEKENA